MENPNQSASHFLFPTPSPSPRLVYERFEVNNAIQLLSMFKEDNNSFVSENFKHEPLVIKYTAHIVRHSRNSAKHGGVDFFFKTLEGHYAGILHLYDLNVENYGTEKATCTVGFATAAPFRRKGYTLEALKHFIEYIFENYEVASIIAYTHERNRPSQNLMLKAGFQFAKYDLLQEDLFIYFEIRRKQTEHEI